MIQEMDNANAHNRLRFENKYLPKAFPVVLLDKRLAYWQKMMETKVTPAATVQGCKARNFGWGNSLPGMAANVTQQLMMLLEQFERERLGALRQCAVTHHVGQHDGPEPAMFGVGHGNVGPLLWVKGRGSSHVGASNKRSKSSPPDAVRSSRRKEALIASGN